MSYGTDISCVEDICPDLRQSSDSTALVQCVVHLWMTRRGSLWYAPSRGVDLQDWLGSGVPDHVIEGRLRAEALRDERVADCRVSVSRSRNGSAINVVAKISGKGSNEVYDLTLSVSELSYEVITA